MNAQFMELAARTCSRLRSPSVPNFVISLIILVGILISYLPQHHRIIWRRSSEGISPYFLLLGTTSGTCAFANILVLPRSRADVACCKQISGYECFAGLLGIAQVGVQWACFAVILLLFLVFFPRAQNLNLAKSNLNKTPSYSAALAVAGICLVHLVVTGILSIYFALRHPAGLGMWANVLGIMATVLASIQYFPQIWTTWRLKHVGSLSIPMMLIQTPGSFLWAGSLAARLGKEGWSAWGVYVVTGCLQGTLLFMGSYFELNEWRQRKEMERNGQLPRHAGSETDDEGGHNVEGDAEDGPNERTGLLRSNR